MRNKKEIHFHRFKIIAKFLFLSKFIGYKYMKCGVDSTYGYDRYPEGLPKYTGIEIFGVGKFGELPSNKIPIVSNKDNSHISI